MLLEKSGRYTWNIRKAGSANFPKEKGNAQAAWRTDPKKVVRADVWVISVHMPPICRIYNRIKNFKALR
ncbi:MAG: hypothetical protein WDN26_20185 [Chitinophagaceae bacterium]